KIHKECLGERDDRPGIDSLGYCQSADKAHGVEDGHKEHEIGREAVEKNDEPTHGRFSIRDGGETAPASVAWTRICPPAIRPRVAKRLRGKLDLGLSCA